MTIQFFMKRFVEREALKKNKTFLRPFDQLESMVLISATNLDQAISNLNWLNTQYPHFKNIKLINFTNEKIVVSKTNQQACLSEMHAKHFGIFGNMKNEIREELTQTHYQLLINTDTSLSIFTHAIATTMNADLKIGLGKYNFNGIYNIHLFSKDDIDFKSYLKQVQTYVNSLAGNDDFNK